MQRCLFRGRLGGQKLGLAPLELLTAAALNDCPYCVEDIGDGPDGIYVVQPMGIALGRQVQHHFRSVPVFMAVTFPHEIPHRRSSDRGGNAWQWSGSTVPRSRLVACMTFLKTTFVAACELSFASNSRRRIMKRFSFFLISSSKCSRLQEAWSSRGKLVDSKIVVTLSSEGSVHILSLAASNVLITVIPANPVHQAA